MKQNKVSYKTKRKLCVDKDHPIDYKVKFSPKAEDPYPLLVQSWDALRQSRHLSFVVLKTMTQLYYVKWFESLGFILTR